MPFERLLTLLAIGALKLAAMAEPVAAGEPSTRSASTFSVVALGTSLTARNDWPAALERELSLCLARPVHVATMAKSGETTVWALTQLDRLVTAKPDVVLIELYANDAALDRWISLSESRANIAAILDRIRSDLPEARVVVMGMNPIHGLRGWMRPWLDDYVAAHRDEALARGYRFVDHSPAWAVLGEDLSEVIPDGAHPTDGSARKIIVPRLVDEISEGRCD